MRIFLRRLAIFLTLPAAVLLALSVYWNVSRTDDRADYFAASFLALWCVFVWGMYWVISPLTKPSASKVHIPTPASSDMEGNGEISKKAAWEGLRILSAGGSLEDATQAIESAERQRSNASGIERKVL